ncbi:FAD-dependent oxidoreductase [Cereibacter changlensis]|uniref:FAD-dependent oxidoreductase n=1 Tax=Cereibacter changlensis TaxID=402884 RepID=UPI00403469D9
MTDHHILGAGVMGLCTAVELARRGASVTVHDPLGLPGPHQCSWWAGGMLAPRCEGETAEEVVVSEGLKAVDWWQAQGAEVTRNGTLVVALGRDRAELDRFARRTTGHSLLSAEEVAEIEPLLAGRFSRGLFFAEEAHLDPQAALAALVVRAKELGVRFTTDSAAEGTVIDCRGTAARDILPDLRGVKGEMLILHSPEITLSRPVRLLHPRIPVYIVPRGDGTFMLGATMIESAERNRASVRSVLELLTAAYALHPAFGEAEIVEIGHDARPAFPDNLPRLRHAGGRLCLNGLYRHGYLMAPALARMAADHLLEGRNALLEEALPA